MSRLAAGFPAWRRLAALTVLIVGVPACTIIHYHDGTGPRDDDDEPTPAPTMDPADEDPTPDPEPEPDEPVATCLEKDAEPIEMITEPSGTLDGCDVPRRAAATLNANGFATASDSTVTRPSKAFDGNSGTKVTLRGDMSWLAYEFAGYEAHVAASYSLTPASDADGDAVEFPSSWELQGSSSPPCAKDIEWTTIDTRSDESFVLRHDTRTYQIASPQAFHRYRLVVSGAAADSGFQLSELQLFGPGEPTFSIDDTFANTDDNAFTTKAKTASTIDHESQRFHGSSSWMSKTGDVMRVAFVGSRVRLFGVEDPAHGIAAVAVDDGPEGRADLWGPMTRYNHFVWDSEELCPGQHELTIRVTGEKNPESKDHFVSIDRVEVQP